MMGTYLNKKGICFFGKISLLRTVVAFLLSAALLAVCGEKKGFCLGWEETVIRHLPDTSFASVERDSSGNRIRHCPYRDTEGNIDYEQLIYALGTLSENEWVNIKEKEKAGKVLMLHYEQYLKEKLKDGLQAPLNINTEPLTRLVMLPGIGPVLAVKIVKYRSENGPFPQVEDIQKIGGIGPRTFQALRFYIRTDQR